ncbi:Sodium/glucose cotransporter [Poriferisphaera corsica]|uniref:Sodium/glucose cotransporter n=1 Tax=Poriferisphaera corsica TaxID=2528020 RepID=A0A517YYF4_9BACT|nr:hypothetical protein [Poriferisphaera corsica]QDU35255.1 Sodium/glucose cotransporter [Poriferisphaera corsica]
MTYTLAAFGTLDWFVILGYMAVMVVVGLFASRGQKDEETYFLGGRKIPTWAASISVLATALSAATFIGVPQSTYNGDISYMILNIGGIIAAILVATMLIPAYYKAGTVTIYGYLGQRMGSGAKIAASITFFFGRLLSSGSRFYMVGIPFALLIFGERFLNPETESMSFMERFLEQDMFMIFTLIILGIIGVVYVAFGGITAVIWTDVIQFFVMTGAVIFAIVWIYTSLPADTDVIKELTEAAVYEVQQVEANVLGNAEGAPAIEDTGIVNDALSAEAKGSVLVQKMNEDGTVFTKNKLNLWDWGISKAGELEYWKMFTFIAALASILGTMASYGVDQDMVQRTMTTKSPARASWGMVSAILFSIPVVFLFVIVGLLLSFYYARPDIMAPAEVLSKETSGFVFPMFMKNEMPTIVAGLAVAGLLAAAMSTYDSAVNSMSSTAVTDIIAPIAEKMGHKLDSKKTLFFSRIMVAIVGVMLTVFGVLSIYLARTFTDLLSFALGVMSYPYAGLLGVFLVAVLTKKRGNSVSAIAAMVVGASLVFALNNSATIWWWFEHGFTKATPEEWTAWCEFHVIQWPYWMLIATPITFTICALGKSPEKLVRKQAEKKQIEIEEKAEKKAAKRAAKGQARA